MSARRESTALVGVGVTACVACCAGPILGVLSAIGLGTAVGVASFGIGALVIGVAATVVVLGRRRRRVATCAPTSGVVDPVRVELARRPRP